MKLGLQQTLAELVAIPSVNPMRKPAPTDLVESRLTDHLEQWFSKIGLKTQRQTIEHGRDNLVARLDGSDAAPVVLLDAHQDTVPVEGMTIEPFTPVVRDGRLYGRGSCDIKGGMAAMLGAVARLANESASHRPTVIMSCTVNEEHGFTGAQGLCELWRQPQRPQGENAATPGPATSQRTDSASMAVFLPRRPDFAIVAEPTDLDVVIAHKGMVRWQCRTLGRASHSSVPHLGENAIFYMAPVLGTLERYDREVLANAPSHPHCGRPTLSVGTIHGGLSVNTVPASCTIEIDRRILPDDDPEEEYQKVIDYLAAHVDRSQAMEHLPPMMTSRGLSDAKNGHLAQRLAAVAGEVRGTARKIGVPFGTNATAFGQHFPTVVFGPGSIAQAHTCDEWVPLDEVEQASEILYRFLRNLGTMRDLLV